MLEYYYIDNKYIMPFIKLPTKSSIYDNNLSKNIILFDENDMPKNYSIY